MKQKAVTQKELRQRFADAAKFRPWMNAPLVPATAVTEKDLLQWVTDMARLRTWMVYHTWNSRHSSAGFPDIVLARRERMVFIELKRQNGKLKPAQEAWLNALRQVPGVEVHLWRPKDWFDGTVDGALA